jgi:hypothetical protein
MVITAEHDSGFCRWAVVTIPESGAGRDAGDGTCAARATRTGPAICHACDNSGDARHPTSMLVLAGTTCVGVAAWWVVERPLLSVLRRTERRPAAPGPPISTG